MGNDAYGIKPGTPVKMLAFYSMGQHLGDYTWLTGYKGGTFPDPTQTDGEAAKNLPAYADRIHQSLAEVLRNERGGKH